MGIPLLYPDGIFEVEIISFVPMNQPELVLGADPYRIFVGASGSNFGFWGFSSNVSAANEVGVRSTDVGRIEWKWEYVGPLLQRDLFFDDFGSGLPIYIETVMNWPKSAKVDREAIRRSQAERTNAAQLVNRIKGRLEGIKRSISERRTNGRT